MLLELSARNGITLPYASVDEVRAAYAFESLQDFLNVYYRGMSALVNEADFYELTLAYCKRAHADSVRYAEIFFDPQGHTERGVALEAVIGGISAALAVAERYFCFRSGLIMCFLRHLPQQSALQTLDAALPHRAKLLGVGLDSSERGFPPQLFTDVFERAKRHGLHRVAHAGEEGPAEYVRGAIESLQVERIDHGNNALSDDLLVRNWSLQACR